MKHGFLRASLVVLAAIAIVGAPGCVRRSKVLPSGSPTPIPVNIPFVIGACLTPSSAARHTAAATPTPIPSISPAPFTIDSTPQNLAVTIDGTPAGHTPLTETPAFSNSLHVIKISNGAGGSLTTILGYRGVAPADDPVGTEIAQRMSATIAGGLSDEQWVLAWLKINGDHPGQNTYNAAGIDSRGFWWIKERSTWDRSHDFFFWTGPGYVIAGPAPLWHP